MMIGRYTFSVWCLWLLAVSVAPLAACAEDACGDVQPQPGHKPPYTAKNDQQRAVEKAGGRFFGDDTLRFGGGEKKTQTAASTESGAINTFLWRGAMEALSFAPKRAVDPFAGYIATEWYQAPGVDDERTMVEAHILSARMRTDALRVVVHTEKFENGAWQRLRSNADVAHRLEEAIFERARDLKSQE